MFISGDNHIDILSWYQTKSYGAEFYIPNIRTHARLSKVMIQTASNVDEIMFIEGDNRYSAAYNYVFTTAKPFTT